LASRERPFQGETSSIPTAGESMKKKGNGGQTLRTRRDPPLNLPPVRPWGKKVEPGGKIVKEPVCLFKAEKKPRKITHKKFT